MTHSAGRALGPIVFLGLSTLACLNVGDMLEGIGEPIPMGTPIVTGYDSPGWQARPAVAIGSAQEAGGLIVIVNEVVRPANQLAQLGFSLSDPDAGQEYLAVEIRATCNLPADQVCYPSTFDFGVSGMRGISYVPEIVTSGTRQPFTSGGLSGGESRSGYLIFEVSQDDSQLVLRYPNLFGGLAGSGSFLLEE